ncbi:MAG: hypothetical protein II433_10095 [Acidaminococcaceae bacterium]|nr:hypothetical protein [Acidaminococcaceae bacterium]
MSLFNQLGNQPNMMTQLRANPAAMLKQRGLNIPDGMTDPQQIINHLLQTGQINNSRLQMAQQMMAQMRR